MVWLKALEQRAAVLLRSVPVFPKALSDSETLSVGLAATRYRNKLRLIERWLFIEGLLSTSRSKLSASYKSAQSSLKNNAFQDDLMCV